MNLARMESQVARRAGITGGHPVEAELADYINEAASAVETEEVNGWPWMRALVSTTTTASDPDSLTFPVLGALVETGLVAAKIEGVAITPSGAASLIPLQRVSAHEGRALYRSTVTGLPQVWAVETERVYLFPTPDAAYTVQVNLVVSERVLDEPEDTPLLPVRFHPALVEYATGLVFRRLNDSVRATQAFSSFSEWVRRIRKGARSYVGPGRVRADGW